MWMVKHKKFTCNKNVDIYDLWKSNFVRGKFLKIRLSRNLPRGHARSHKKNWARLVQLFWRLLDTNKQTHTHPRQEKYIYLIPFICGRERKESDSSFDFKDSNKHETQQLFSVNRAKMLARPDRFSRFDVHCIQTDRKTSQI